jgi:predicted MFS family arabinose efflux permease
MPLISRRTVLFVGLSQLINWGITYYLVGAFGTLIAADLGWSPPVVYGGFTSGLVVMGLVSPVAGRTIDLYGGRRVMILGSVLAAIGCAGIALAHGIITYYAAWVCVGLAMRLTLYEAAFAALARIGGPEAKNPISQITLLGGLASTTFWPIGHLLAEHFGWRGAVLAYSGFALLTIPLHLAIPTSRYDHARTGQSETKHVPLAQNGRDRLVAASLYATIASLANFLNSGMSSHMIALLAGYGIAASTAVWISSLRGIGQSSSRFSEVMFGSRIHPLTLNLLAAMVLPFCFVAGLFSGKLLIAAIVFAFFYGAGNGILTITRGTLPLALFDHSTYGAYTGQLLVPSFILSAFAPIAYAFVIGRFGEGGALYLSAALAMVILAAAVTLKIKFGPPLRGRGRGGPAGPA